MYIIYRNSRNWVFFFLVKLLFYKTNSLCCLVLGVFYAKIWVPQKGYIDKRTCSNTCFDTIFRGLQSLLMEYVMLIYMFNHCDFSLKLKLVTKVVFWIAQVPMRIQEQPRTNMFISMLPGRHLVSGYLPLCSFYWPMRASTT